MINSSWRAISALVFAAVAFAAAPESVAVAETLNHSDEGVELLFIKAKKDAATFVDSLQTLDPASLSLSEGFKTWLKDPGRLAKLQVYLRTMSLSFIDEPCMEQGRPRSASYDDSDPLKPRMLVSRSANRGTTPSEALALVFHQVGHFTGEADHLFLQEFGVEMAMLQEALKPKPKPVKVSADGSYSKPMRGHGDPNFVLWHACDAAYRDASARAMHQCVLENPGQVCHVLSTVVTHRDAQRVSANRCGGRTVCRTTWAGYCTVEAVATVKP